MCVSKLTHIYFPAKKFEAVLLYIKLTTVSKIKQSLIQETASTHETNSYHKGYHEPIIAHISWL